MIDKKTTMAACHAVMDGFTWGETMEGADYWVRVHHRLSQLAKGVRGDEPDSINEYKNKTHNLDK